MTTETQVEFIPQDRFDRREFRVGDALWFVPSGRRDCRPVTIEKVGRKYFYFSLYRGTARVAINGRALNAYEGNSGDGYLAGFCCQSQEVHEHSQRRSRIQAAFLRKMRNMYGIPQSVTTDDILAAAKLLGLEIET